MRARLRIRSSNLKLSSSYLLINVHAIAVAAIEFVLERDLKKRVSTFVSCVASAAGFRYFFRFCEQVGPFFLQFLCAFGIKRPVKVFFSIDPGLKANGAGVQRRFRPDGEVRVLARFK